MTADLTHTGVPMRKFQWIRPGPMFLFLCLAAVRLAAVAADALPVLVERLHPPRDEAADAIWGATGIDRDGNVWFGISAKRPGDSARLVRFAPSSGQWTEAGAVNTQLARSGAGRPGESQVKIHSRIVEAADGWLYFASMDEEGEREDGSALPRWGSHLWRVDPRTLRWEHLLAVPEGLVALGGAGFDVVALGYWNHVVYRYDIRTGEVVRREAGAVEGHASRNVLVDTSGNVFVPRAERDGTGRLRASLIHYDRYLQETGASPLPDYFGPGDSPESNHGVVGLSPGSGGGLVFTTHHGQWYRVSVQPGGPATLEPLGLFPSWGEAYTPSLFALEGGGRFGAVVRRAAEHVFVVRDSQSGIARVFPLGESAGPGSLLYGSMTVDAQGRCYLVGRIDGTEPGRHEPLILRVRP